MAQVHGLCYVSLCASHTHKREIPMTHGFLFKRHTRSPPIHHGLAVLTLYRYPHTAFEIQVFVTLRPSTHLLSPLTMNARAPFNVEQSGKEPPPRPQLSPPLYVAQKPFAHTLKRPYCSRSKQQKNIKVLSVHTRARAHLQLHCGVPQYCLSLPIQWSKPTGGGRRRRERGVF